MKSSIIWAAILIILGFLGVNAYLEQQKEPIQLEEKEPTGMASVGGKFLLTDQNGAAFSSDQLQGKFSLIFFGFTHCPAICPTGLQVMSNAMSLLDAVADAVTPVFITVDPARDTVARNKEFFQEFHPSFVALTGSQEAIDEAKKAWRVYAQKVEMENSMMDGYMFDHSSLIYLMDRQGTLLEVFSHDVDAGIIAARIRSALDEEK